MLMNNLDPEVAEKPDELIVYGGSGRAAPSWAELDTLVATLRRLEGDETLLVQSGRAVGVIRTHADAPRVLISNAMLVPKWATWDEFRRLEALGLTMYGQMTAGSWIYIGTQGILQGTYETLSACARKHFSTGAVGVGGAGVGGAGVSPGGVGVSPGGVGVSPADAPLRGRLVVSGGLGGLGGAQPLAATMNGAAFLGADVDRRHIERRVRTGYCDKLTQDVDEALDWVLKARDAGAPLSVGLVGNIADLLAVLIARNITPDVLTDQTAAHDPLSGYVPSGMGYRAARALRRTRPQQYVEAALRTMADHVACMLELQRRGAVTFEYGNNLRAHAKEAAEKGLFDQSRIQNPKSKLDFDPFRIPGFVPEYIRPLFCEGAGPFCWVALSGDPADIAATDQAVLDTFPEEEHLCRWIRLVREKVAFQGLPARICWLGYGERAAFALRINELVALGKIKAPIVIGRDHLDLRRG
jgi:urocanate hydratase